MEVAALLADPAAAGIVVGVVALVLLGAAWHKLSEPNAFLSALAAYRIVPAGLLDPIAKAVPWMEIAIAAALLVPMSRVGALFAAAVLFLMYGAAIAINLLRGRSYIDCGCGGAAHPLSWGLVVRNAVLAAAALAVTTPTSDRAFDWLDAVTLVAGVLAFYMAYLMADELLRQASRMARAERSSGQHEGTLS
jgi:hypothetical protein